MSTYKVIQDIEAEDTLVGPLTLRQFIYAGIAAVCLYLGFLCVTKGAPWALIIFIPIAGVTGFFAFPFKQDQPTEVWALAKLRFLFKPRKRIWDQSGAKDMVTVTVPKKIERVLTNGLDQSEVQSRLSALAMTIDSRGWALKDPTVNMNNPSSQLLSSDRLVAPSSMPQQVSDYGIHASDDILDEAANPIAQHFDTMIDAASAAHHQQLVAQMQQSPTTPAAQPANSQWFVGQPAVSGFTQAPAIPQAAEPTAEEQALVEKFKHENSITTPAYDHLKHVKTPEELLAEDAALRAASVSVKPAVTPANQAAIMNLAQNDDLDIATIARQAHKADENGEVVISLR